MPRLRCAANTVNNTRCKNVCIKDRVYCNCHENMKEEMYEKYKNVCNKIWTVPCTKKYLSTLSEEEIRVMISDMNKCARLRCSFARKCCDNSMDIKHLGAIQKIEKNMCKCFDILKEMDPILYRRLPKEWCSVYKKKPNLEMTKTKEERAAANALGRALRKQRDEEKRQRELNKRERIKLYFD